MKSNYIKPYCIICLEPDNLIKHGLCSCRKFDNSNMHLECKKKFINDLKDKEITQCRICTDKYDIVIKNPYIYTYTFSCLEILCMIMLALLISFDVIYVKNSTLSIMICESKIIDIIFCFAILIIFLFGKGKGYFKRVIIGISENAFVTVLVLHAIFIGYTFTNFLIVTHVLKYLLLILFEILPRNFGFKIENNIIFKEK